MEKYYSQDTPVREALRNMEVGDKAHFPINRLSVIRSTASTLGLELSRKYQSRHHSKEGIITVTRLS